MADGEASSFAVFLATAFARPLLCEAARNDLMGFYHGMRVSRVKNEFVFCDPEERFMPDGKRQLDLLNVHSAAW